MMNKVKTVILVLKLQLITLVFLPLAAYSQSKIEMKKIFARAESYFLFGEYDLAKQLYLQLESPDNSNIKYKIGACYVNILYEKDKAIPYLEEAVKNSSYDAKISTFREKRAPLDAYFFLSKAYLINNEPEKALRTLETFSKLASDKKDKGGMKNLEFVDQVKKACHNAISYEASPVSFNKKLLTPFFSQGSINDNPAVSFDGNTIVYTEQKGISNVIMYSRKINGVWQPPIAISSAIGADDDSYSCSLNTDGTLLLLYKSDTYDGNIYSSEYINGQWTPVKKLNSNINTRFYESHASISSDGKKLYFTSNRDGGLGGLDIYMSEKDPSGDWGPAENLGMAINTKYNEETPFITQNDMILFFSSEGHNSMGGYDNYMSRKTGAGWEATENLGFPINSTDDDRFFQPFNDGNSGFYSISTGYKMKDIFYITFGPGEQVTAYEIRGNYSLSDTLVEYNDNYAIHLIDKVSGDTIDVGYPNRHTGQYNFIVSPGDFRIVYKGIGHLAQVIDTTISPSNRVTIVKLDVSLDRDPDYKPEVLASASPLKYEKINLSKIPVVDTIDPNILIRNMNVTDITDSNVQESDVLYYTVQVMALYTPVDITYFKHVNDIKVMYNDKDKFYRYTTGIFATKDEAYAYRLRLITMGYPDDLFIKKVSKQ